jgi:hypothetical protein
MYVRALVLAFVLEGAFDSTASPSNDAGVTMQSLTTDDRADDGWDDDAVLTNPSKSNQGRQEGDFLSSDLTEDEVGKLWEDDVLFRDIEGMMTNVNVKTHPRNAHYWSEQHKSRPKYEVLQHNLSSIIDTADKWPKVAVLITGMLRFSDQHHLTAVKRAASGALFPGCLSVPFASAAFTHVTLCSLLLPLRP